MCQFYKPTRSYRVLPIKDKLDCPILGLKRRIVADVKRVYLNHGIYYGIIVISGIILRVQSENSRVWEVIS